MKPTYIKVSNNYWERHCTNPPKFEKSNCALSLFGQDSPKTLKKNA